MIDTVRRERIRSQVAAQRAAAHELVEQLVDDGIKHQFTTPLHILDDVDRMFLSHSDSQSADQEDFWLNNAEQTLAIATALLNRLTELIQKFGGPANARTVGS